MDYCQTISWYRGVATTVLLALAVLLPINGEALPENKVSENNTPANARPEKIDKEVEAVVDEEQIQNDGPWYMDDAEWLTKEHDYLSKKFVSSGSWMDKYLSRDAFRADIPNASYVRIRLQEYVTQADGNGFSGSINAHYDLPNTKRHFRLFFNSDNEDFRNLTETRGSTVLPEKANQDPEVGLSLIGKETRRWHPHVNVGLPLHLPFDPFVKGGVKRLFALPDKWNSQLKQTVYYYDVEGLGATTDLSFYRPIFDDSTLSSNSEAMYWKDEQEWQFYQGFSIYHRFSKRNSLEYNIGLASANRSDYQTESYWFRVNWRHLLYKKWLYLKVAPELLYPRDRDFEITPGIFFQLEVYFDDITPEQV